MDEMDVVEMKVVVLGRWLIHFIEGVPINSNPAQAIPRRSFLYKTTHQANKQVSKARNKATNSLCILLFL